MRSFLKFLVAATMCLAVHSAASAQDYPNRLITIVVPFPAGSATDGIARRLADFIRSETSHPVVIENKPGADGNLAAVSVLRNPADGYTLFVTTNSTHAANASLFTSMGYDPEKDFVPVGGLVRIPMVLVVKADYPAKNIAEFLERAKRAEKPLTFGSGNQTSRGAAELIKARQGLVMHHIPYRGAPQALTDLLGGQIDCFFADPVSAGGLIKEGALRALAVTSKERAASLPNIPTLAESGFADFELIAWVAAFAKSGTPPEIVKKQNALINGFLNDKANQESLAVIGSVPFPTTPIQLGEFAAADTRRWAEIVEVAKMEKK